VKPKLRVVELQPVRGKDLSVQEVALRASARSVQALVRAMEEPAGIQHIVGLDGKTE
jgi:hypothetical protein